MPAKYDCCDHICKDPSHCLERVKSLPAKLRPFVPCRPKLCKQTSKECLGPIFECPYSRKNSMGHTRRSRKISSNSAKNSRADLVFSSYQSLNSDQMSQIIRGPVNFFQESSSVVTRLFSASRSGLNRARDDFSESCHNHNLDIDAEFSNYNNKISNALKNACHMALGQDKTEKIDMIEVTFNNGSTWKYDLAKGEEIERNFEKQKAAGSGRSKKSSLTSEIGPLKGLTKRVSSTIKVKNLKKGKSRATENISAFRKDGLKGLLQVHKDRKKLQNNDKDLSSPKNQPYQSQIAKESYQYSAVEQYNDFYINQEHDVYYDSKDSDEEDWEKQMQRPGFTRWKTAGSVLGFANLNRNRKNNKGIHNVDKDDPQDDPLTKAKKNYLEALRIYQKEQAKHDKMNNNHSQNRSKSNPISPCPISIPPDQQIPTYQNQDNLLSRTSSFFGMAVKFINDKVEESEDVKVGSRDQIPRSKSVQNRSKKNHQQNNNNSNNPSSTVPVLNSLRVPSFGNFFSGGNFLSPNEQSPNRKSATANASKPKITLPSQTEINSQVLQNIVPFYSNMGWIFPMQGTIKFPVNQKNDQGKNESHAMSFVAVKWNLKVDSDTNDA